MKKSVRIFITAISLALCWTVVMGLMAGSTLSSYLSHGELRFAIPYSKVFEKYRKTFPAPVTLQIEGEGTLWVYLVPGKTFSVLGHPRIWDIRYHPGTGGNGVLSIKKVNLNYSEPITITLPAGINVSGKALERLYISRFSGGHMTVRCSAVGLISADSCKLTGFRQESPVTGNDNEIIFGRSNRIDSLTVLINGSGRLKLETVGKVLNQFSLANSVRVEGNLDLIRAVKLK